eukprot:5574444-Prymnesium_polylepis.1
MLTSPSGEALEDGRGHARHARVRLQRGPPPSWLQLLTAPQSPASAGPMAVWTASACAIGDSRPLGGRACARASSSVASVPPSLGTYARSATSTASTVWRGTSSGRACMRDSSARQRVCSPASTLPAAPPAGLCRRIESIMSCTAHRLSAPGCRSCAPPPPCRRGAPCAAVASWTAMATEPGTARARRRVESTARRRDLTVHLRLPS